MITECPRCGSVELEWRNIVGFSRLHGYDMDVDVYKCHECDYEGSEFDEEETNSDGIRNLS